MHELILYGVAFLCAISVLFSILVLKRFKGVDASTLSEEIKLFTQHQSRVEASVRDEIGRSRMELAHSVQAQREEMVRTLGAFGDSVSSRIMDVSAMQKGQLEVFSDNLTKYSQVSEQRANVLRELLAEQSRLNRAETANNLKVFSDSLESRLGELSKTVESKLSQIQSMNEKKLDEMRKTVDEQLQGVLEKRLNDSFSLVSQRLEAVHKGLGEMQALANGVGDLKKILSNVKTRGTFGEIQLERLIEQVFAPAQYVKNYKPRDDSGDVVEFAIKIAGRDGDGECMLPIDAKFPTSDYDRLLDALEKNDASAADTSGKQIESTLKAFAKYIQEKYICPPQTTMFAILFLPVEGLFAEALRRPGLVETLQRDHKVIVAGPTTLAAILSSIQMGLAVTAISKRSEEVWKLLGAVKTEFKKYGDVVDKVRKSLNAATNHLENISTRTRAVERTLRGVESLPESESCEVLSAVQSLDVGEGTGKEAE
ncbi:DNA recombination protein RmuC [Fundidesulfovibrio butyratiphilus]